MKKKYLLITILCLFLSINKVNALGIDLRSSSYSLTKGSSATISVTISSSNPLFFIEGTLKCSGAGINGGIDLKYDNMDNNIKSKSYSYSIKPSTSGTVTCSTSGVRLTDSSSDSWQNINGKSITIKVNEPAKVVPKNYSSNNNLTNLEIEGFKLENDFKKDILEYTVSVPNDTKKIKINATKEDSKASISGTGEFEVTEGENNFEIKVTAENGNEKVYKIKVTVLELDPITVTIDGKEYLLVRKTGLIDPPSETYEETKVTISDNEIPAYYSKTTKYTLVALKDSEGIINYYIYDNGKYTLYKEYNFNNTYLYPLNKELEGTYKKVTFTYHEDKINAYKLNPKEGILFKNTYAYDGKSNYYLFYAINTITGEENLYQYDKDENTVQKYNEEEINYYKDIANNYKLYLYIVSGILAITLITFIIVLAKKINTKNKKKITPEME